MSEIKPTNSSKTMPDTLPKIVPVGNRILVELVPVQSSTSSGIILTSSPKTQSQKAKILAIGSSYGEYQGLLKQFQVNQIVILQQNSGQVIEGFNSEIIYKIVNAEDIIGILE